MIQSAKIGLLIASLIMNSPTSHAQIRCNTAVSNESSTKSKLESTEIADQSFGTYTYKGQTFNVLKANELTATQGRYRAQDLLIDKDPERKVIITFSGANVGMNYNGFRTQSSGIRGARITSEVEKSPYLGGDIAFVFYNMDENVIQALKRNFSELRNQESSFTCAGAVCKHLTKAGSTLIKSPPFFPSTLFTKLLKYKAEGGDIEIVMLNSHYSSVNALKRAIIAEELSHAFIVGAALTIYLLPPVVRLLR